MSLRTFTMTDMSKDSSGNNFIESLPNNVSAIAIIICTFSKDLSFIHRRNIMFITYRIIILSFVFISTAFAQKVVFQERFTNGIPEHSLLAGFNGDELNPYQNSTTPSGDGWVGRLLNKTSGGNVAQSSAENQSFSDFLYEAMVYIPVNEAIYYGIEFRVDPTGLSTGYQFVAAFNPSGVQRMRFRVRPVSSPAVPISIKDWAASEIPGGIPTKSGWHKLSVKALGPHFWFYFDDKEMPGGLVFDQTYSSGSVGVYLWDMLSMNEKLFVDDMKVTALGVSAVEPNKSPLSFHLLDIYPNPVNLNMNSDRIHIDLSLSRPAYIEAFLCDVLGKIIDMKNIDNEIEGRHRITFTANGLPVGMYFTRIVADGITQQRKVIVLR